MGDPEVSYLALADVVALHAALLQRMGQAIAPLRNAGGLESALNRPRMAAQYEEADLIHQAALLGAGVAEAQAFIDGNKRVGLLAVDAFLRLNGVHCVADSFDYARQIESLGAREGNLAAATTRFETWLRARVRFG